MEKEKSNRKRRLALSLSIVFIWVFAGCADQIVTSLEESGQQISVVREIAAAPLLQWEDPDSENLADMLKTQCGGMMVQLEAGQLLGSGVIYSEEENVLVIVTAAHVLSDAEGGIQITFVDGWKTESSDFSLWMQTDLAVVRVDVEQIPEENLENYRKANIDKVSSDGLQAGDGCIVMGCRSGVAEDAYEGTVLEPWIYLEDYGQHMIWVDAHGKPGMSGGGLFDRQGHFLGILSGRSEDGEWAVVPLALLEAQRSLR